MSEEEKIAQIIKDELHINGVGTDYSKDLMEEGVDSVSVLELVFRLEEVYGIDIPDSMLLDVRSIHDMAQVVRTLKSI